MQNSIAEQRNDISEHSTQARASWWCICMSVFVCVYLFVCAVCAGHVRTLGFGSCSIIIICKFTTYRTLSWLSFCRLLRADFFTHTHTIKHTLSTHWETLRHEARANILFISFILMTVGQDWLVEFPQHNTLWTLVEIKRSLCWLICIYFFRFIFLDIPHRAWLQISRPSLCALRSKLIRFGAAEKTRVLGPSFDSIRIRRLAFDSCVVVKSTRSNHHRKATTTTTNTRA